MAEFSDLSFYKVAIIQKFQIFKFVSMKSWKFPYFFETKTEFQQNSAVQPIHFTQENKVASFVQFY